MFLQFYVIVQCWPFVFSKNSGAKTSCRGLDGLLKEIDSTGLTERQTRSGGVSTGGNDALTAAAAAAGHWRRRLNACVKADGALQTLFAVKFNKRETQRDLLEIMLVFGRCWCVYWLFCQYKLAALQQLLHRFCA